MSNIKSAREIAIEKVESLGQATEEERLKWKYIPKGEELAAEYLTQGRNLASSLSEYGEDARNYLIAGIEDILTRNIGLPKSDSQRRSNKKAMDGLKTIKKDKVAVENVYSKMRNIFNHYAEQGEKQRREAYESLKVEFESKFQQAVQQQLGTSMGIKVDIEKQPQFQVEWRKVQTQFDSQYITLLDGYKHELKAIS